MVPAVNQIELHPWLQQAELRALHASLGHHAPRRGARWAAARCCRTRWSLELAAAHRRTAAQVILRWHLELGNVVIPKASSYARIRENHDIFGFSLGTADLDALAGLERGFRTGSNPDDVN